MSKFFYVCLLYNLSMSSTIIECRERDGVNNSQNNSYGEWETIIQDPITIANGDQVVIKSSFIDTSASESQKIPIPYDLDLHMTMNFHLMRTFPTGQIDIAGAPSVAADVKGDAYIACSQISSGPRPGYYMADTIAYVFGDDDGNYGNVTLKLQYTNENDDLATIDIYLPQANNYNNDPDQGDGWFAGFPTIIFKSSVVPTTSNSDKLGLTILNPQDLINANVKPQFGYDQNSNRWDELTNLLIGGQSGNKWNVVAPTVADNDIYTPITVSTTLNLPKGNYSPQDLVLTLNQQMQRNVTPQGSMYNTPFVITGSNQKPANIYLLNGDGNQNKVLYMVKTDASEVFRFDGTVQINGVDVQYLIGATQMEITYDDSQQKFKWSYMHQPYYSTTPGAAPPPGSTGTMFSGWLNLNGIVEVSRNGGITFANLSATRQDNGQSYDFWSNTLGFDLESIIGANRTVIFGGTQLSHRPIIVGQTTTSGFTGLGNAVNLTNANGQWWNAIIQPVNIMNPVESSVEIDGSASILNETFSYGYFLIEIQAKFRNNFMSADETYPFISQIVSRYYSINSYTSASDGMITYTHKGEPMTLSSFKIRILNSDKIVPPNLGDDNTIFLEIIKNNIN